LAQEKRARGGTANLIRIPPRFDACGRGAGGGRKRDLHRYRSVLVLLKYGRDGPAIMTTAITNPASNETDSINILLTHFARIRS
jgi:hypothetical protein